MLKSFAKVLLVTSIWALFLPQISFAQFNLNTSFSFSNELGVEVNPTYPRPNEPVSVFITLYTGDLNSADIVWYKNSKEVLRGKGETRYTFVAPAVGEEAVIKIDVNLLGGSSFSKTFTLTPASVDLVWEADSYVPPFYRGKALHSRQGGLKVVAMPEFVKNGQRMSPQNLIYEWSNGLDVYQSRSGYGKNVITFDGSLLGMVENLRVLVTDPINNLVAQSFIQIKPTDPEIVFYENNPYYGHIFDQALINSFDLKTDEVQIVATPFYFTKEAGGLLKYEWRLNGKSIPNLFGSRTAIFRKPEGESGQSVIALTLENQNRILQQADNSLIMNFNK